MAPVRITVKSQLPEFPNLDIQQAPIEPDITWGAFFQFHQGVAFNPQVHAVRSSKNTAFAEDTIQQTSEMYKRSAITVNIVRADDELRKRNQSRRGRGRISRGGRRGGSRPGGSGIRASQIPMVEVPVPMSSTSREQRNATLPRARPNGAGQNALPLFPEDQLTNGGSGLPPGPPELDHLRYAESLASEDSQEGELIGENNPSFSRLKIRILKEIGKVPNADLDRMLVELKALVRGEQKYRWTRKAPMTGSLVLQMFGV